MKYSAYCSQLQNHQNNGFHIDWNISDWYREVCSKYNGVPCNNCPCLKINQKSKE
jgi:hypothetical protein